MKINTYRDILGVLCIVMILGVLGVSWDDIEPQEDY